MGAGASGLASLKSCLEANLGYVTCYEQADVIGGLWCYQKVNKFLLHIILNLTEFKTYLGSLYGINIYIYILHT